LITRLNIKPEVHHIAILDDIVLAFQPPFPGLFGTVFAFVVDEIVIANDFGADKAFFKISVDHRSGLRGGCAHLDGPGTNFLHACGEIGLQVQEVIRGADDAVKAGFAQSKIGQKFIAVGIVKLAEFFFDGGRNRDNFRAFALCAGAHGIKVRVVVTSTLAI